MAPAGKQVRIGGASGFWGDSALAAPQLIDRARPDYLVFDYLAELTMSIMAAARGKNPDLGYATDFVDVTMKSILKDIAARNIRVISNAGGVNPRACAKAVQAVAESLGIAVKVAVVSGDDVLPLAADLLHMASGEAEARRPERLLTANAYLGALPIKSALDAEAQIVITGRCVDSALTLGALMHEFGWASDDYDRLAQGSLAGHIIECGCQATGGLHTDWREVPDWPHIGYPIVECEADGRFVVTKPEGTGGLVSPPVIAEQMLYEIGDPARYLLPDVVCDFTRVTMRQQSANRVAVEGAKGLPPGDRYKVSATAATGYRCAAQLTIVGVDAVEKAQRTGEALLVRTREIFAARGLEDYSRTAIEVLGSEQANFGSKASANGPREVVLRVAVRHPQKAALDLFSREIAPAVTSWSPGTTGVEGRPKPGVCIEQFAFMIAKQRLAPMVEMAGGQWTVPIPTGSDDVTLPPPFVSEDDAAAPAQSDEPGRHVPLIHLAYARSGDKGNISNIGVIARRPEWLPLLRSQLTAERVADYLSHLVKGTVTRYDVPGIHALNFVCTEALDGGGMVSLRNDPLGKGMAQILLAMPVFLPHRYE